MDFIKNKLTKRRKYDTLDTSDASKKIKTSTYTQIPENLINFPSGDTQQEIFNLSNFYAENKLTNPGNKTELIDENGNILQSGSKIAENDHNKILNCSYFVPKIDNVVSTSKKRISIFQADVSKSESCERTGKQLKTSTPKTCSGTQDTRISKSSTKASFPYFKGFIRSLKPTRVYNVQHLEQSFENSSYSSEMPKDLSTMKKYRKNRSQSVDGRNLDKKFVKIDEKLCNQATENTTYEHTQHKFEGLKSSTIETAIYKMDSLKPNTVPENISFSSNFAKSMDNLSRCRRTLTRKQYEERLSTLMETTETKLHSFDGNSEISYLQDDDFERNSENFDEAFVKFDDCSGLEKKYDEILQETCTRFEDDLEICQVLDKDIAKLIRNQNISNQSQKITEKFEYDQQNFKKSFDSCENFQEFPKNLLTQHHSFPTFTPKNPPKVVKFHPKTAAIATQTEQNSDTSTLQAIIDDLKLQNYLKDLKIEQLEKIDKLKTQQMEKITKIAEKKFTEIQKRENLLKIVKIQAEISQETGQIRCELRAKIKHLEKISEILCAKDEKIEKLERMVELQSLELKNQQQKIDNLESTVKFRGDKLLVLAKCWEDSHEFACRLYEAKKDEWQQKFMELKGVINELEYKADDRCEITTRKRKRNSDIEQGATEGRHKLVRNSELNPKLTKFNKKSEFSGEKFSKNDKV